MRTRLTERQTGRKGDKQAAGAAIVVMDRAARCSQPATRNVGDPAKRLLRQNQSWLSKVRVAQLGNPTVRQLLYLGARSKLELRCSRQGAGTSVREGPRWSQKRVHERPLAGRESIHKAKQMMMTSPRISKSAHARTYPTINFVYRAGSAQNMSTGRLPMLKVWSQTFPTDRRAANHLQTLKSQDRDDQAPTRHPPHHVPTRQRPGYHHACLEGGLAQDRAEGASVKA